MRKEECFAMWAPAGVVWAQWAKPVSFVDLDPLLLAPAPDPGDWTVPGLDRVPTERNLAIVVDLRSEDAVRAGVMLARLGYRPVPLFNGTDGPHAIIDVDPLMRRLVSGCSHIADAALRPDAPPAFLLDARRMDPDLVPEPGRFDNRWVTLPQDFPSGTFLLTHGVSVAILVQRDRTDPRPDLAHVLRRWQDAGLRLQAIDLNQPGDPQPLRVEAPSLFRRAWYRAVAVMGLHRNNVGGFGATIPEEGSGFSGGFG